MTDIPENELVRKYFDCNGCDSAQSNKEHWRNGHMAERILRAMQEPIKNGDRYLNIYSGGIEECIWTNTIVIDELHLDQLRLPDRFQTGQEKFCCDLHRHVPGVSEYPCVMKKPPSTVGCSCLCHLSQGWQSSCPNCRDRHQKQKCKDVDVAGHHAVANCPCLCCKSADAVEAKMKEIIETPWHQTMQGSYRKALRELVKLARESK